MKRILFGAGCFLSMCLFLEAQNSAETLPVSKSPQTIQLQKSFGNYQLFSANNSEMPSAKRNQGSFSELAMNTYEDPWSDNSAKAEGPGLKNTAYEIFCRSNSKGQAIREQFLQFAFIDSTTLVSFAIEDGSASLVFIDISGEKMYITARLQLPGEFEDGRLAPNKELFFIDRETQDIFVPVNNTMPGLWIIKPVRNEEKKWSMSQDQVTQYYFNDNALASYAKKGLRIETAHLDNSGNVWLGFSEGVIGVMPFLALNEQNNSPMYEELVYLYNANKNMELQSASNTYFTNKIYERLKNAYDPETNDTTKIFTHLYKKPSNYTGLYLEDARYLIYSNLVRDANAKLDSGEVVQNESQYWQYVNIDVDNPYSKSKKKLSEYFGFKVRKSQSFQNGFTSGNDQSVFATTNLGLYKFKFDPNKKEIKTAWAVPYANSFIKDHDAGTATSPTTAAFNADHNEVAICDNDFPDINLLIFDATSGRLKFSFPLFERAYASRASNGLVFSNNMIVVSNTFGNTDNKAANPASGIMKFYSSSRGTWYNDYDWNAMQRNTAANTATPKLSDKSEQVYIYQQDANQQWQLTSIDTEKRGVLNSSSQTLQPDFGKNLKPELDNHGSNFTFGPQKSIYVGTGSGILRIKSD